MAFVVYLITCAFDRLLRPSRESPRWGCVRISGELAKLGIRVILLEGSRRDVLGGSIHEYHGAAA